MKISIGIDLYEITNEIQRKIYFFPFFFFFKYIFIIEHNTALIRCEKLKIVVKTDLRG